MSSDDKLVCILGTGFSRAICNEIPLLMELEGEVYKKIKDKNRLGYKEEYKIVYDKYICEKKSK